jgi:hypothetical protein
MKTVKAKFITADDKTIPIHFNPSEYSITVNADTSESGHITLDGKKNETLTMKLVFDTYMTEGSWEGSIITEREDVRSYTEPIAQLAAGPVQNKSVVTFVWGSLKFVGVVNSVVQNFTMFMSDGKPVRAALTVTMQGADREPKKPATGFTVDWADNSWKKDLAMQSAACVRLLLDL